MTVLNPPFDGVPVHVEGDLVDRYLALGYTRAEEKKPEPKRAPARKKADD